MIRMSAIQRVLLGLFLAQVSVALISPEGREYCTGDGSICEAFNKIDRECRDETGAAYTKCTCETGWVPLKEACYNCRRTFGEFMFSQLERDQSICKDEGLDVATIPSSIISQQKQYNKTAEYPSMPASDSASSTISIDRSYTTNSHEAYTTTVYGVVASVTLPEISAPTAEEIQEVEDNLGVRQAGSVSVVAVCAAVLAMIIS
ncbi:hypothetical protein CDV36_010052 [Fusarium kuroshium]|uniref:Extracellular membrane protein CFEM domain-containing protein n=1 Tax=Fusarium kuroshium TaxID=2010991 RepID=A0A3M2RYI1_9HYPO|nr:hypothetical protein CDV36_010052 [Fusarium kuroshium]